jgi:hypothetical protein
MIIYSIIQYDVSFSSENFNVSFFTHTLQNQTIQQFENWFILEIFVVLNI